MPSPKITFDVVRTIALALPEVKESTAYRAFALKVRGSARGLLGHQSLRDLPVRAREIVPAGKKIGLAWLARQDG